MSDLGQRPAGAPVSPRAANTLASEGIAPAPGSTFLAGPAAASNEPVTRTFSQVVKDVFLFFAAPFITLAYIALMPSIALAMLVRMGGQAGHHRKATG